jgi:hypothetical protein
VKVGETVTLLVFQLLTQVWHSTFKAEDFLNYYYSFTGFNFKRTYCRNTQLCTLGSSQQQDSFLAAI